MGDEDDEEGAGDKRFGDEVRENVLRLEAAEVGSGVLDLKLRADCWPAVFCGAARGDVSIWRRMVWGCLCNSSLLAVVVVGGLRVKRSEKSGSAHMNGVHGEMS